MAPTSIARLLTSVMVILIVQQVSSANDHDQGIIGAKINLLRVTTTGTDLFQQRGAFSNANGSKILRGRKMLAYAGEKSGNKELATPKRSPEDRKKDTRVDKDNGEKRDNSMVVLEAQADEVANLMRRDYRGATGPKKKPPINNHEPNN